MIFRLESDADSQVLILLTQVILQCFCFRQGSWKERSM